MQHPKGRLGLRLAAYGYGERLQTPAPASFHAGGTRIEYRRGTLTEWYASSPQGLEQGFTLRERPEHPQGGPLEIELAVSGLQPALVGEHIELRCDGRAVLRYTGLRALDAAGRVLAARMIVHSGRIRLEVADRGALYPVTVDPWIQQQELTAADGTSGDVFGHTVALSGNTAIIGAPYKNSYQGVAYVFTCTGTPCAWTQQQELSAGDGTRNDVFGYSVAVSGKTAIIGAIGKDSSRGGAAYVFTCSATPCTWTQQQKLTAADGASGDEFGTRVAVSGTTAVIGAPGKTVGSHSLQGAAYVFTCSATPCTWRQQQKLTASDGASRDQFGNRLAASGHTIIIGNNSSRGAAYVFTCSGTPCTWRQQQELTAADGAHGDEFGYAVAVSGTTAVIGAAYRNSYQGAAYMFNSPAVAATEPPTPPPQSPAPQPKRRVR